MSKLILSDSTSFTIYKSTGISDITIVCANVSAIGTLFNKLTDANLETVKITEDNGTVTSTYTNLKLQNGTYEIADSVFYITVSLREKTETEIAIDALKKEQTRIVAEQELQNNSILELTTLIL